MNKKVESVFDRGYEHIRNKGTHGTRSPVVEGSDHPSNPTLNGKYGHHTTMMIMILIIIMMMMIND